MDINHSSNLFLNVLKQHPTFGTLFKQNLYHCITTIMADILTFVNPSGITFYLVKLSPPHLTSLLSLSIKLHNKQNIFKGEETILIF